jgi:hypothetical protein
MRTIEAVWNLKDIISDINSKTSAIEAIYLFGSRGQGTGTNRSDIDLLLFSKNPLHKADLTGWLTVDSKPVDLFETNDMTMGKSLLNGSSVISNKPGALFAELKAVLLWDNKQGFSDSFENWEQNTRKDTGLQTILPIPSGFEEAIQKFSASTEEHGNANAFPESDWLDLLENLFQIIAQSIRTPEIFNARAKFISNGNFRLENENDLKLLIQVILNPWLPAVENSNADLSILQNKIIIVARYIKSNADVPGILKNLEGLKAFQKNNANTKGLLFVLLVNKEVDLDDAKIQSDFSQRISSPVILVGIIRNSMA